MPEWKQLTFDDLDNEPPASAPEPRTLARSTDASSSRLAAEELVASGRHAAQMQQVLGLVRQHPGSTSDELAEAGGLTRHVTGRRLPDLEKRGLIRRGAQRASKITGRQGLTWWAVASEQADNRVTASGFPQVPAANELPPDGTGVECANHH